METDLATSSGAGVDPRGEIAASPYFNPDLAPTSTAQRKWRLRDMAALWVAMAACVPTYMLASSLIDEGMNWWQAVLTIVLANIIVLVPMILNGHAGTKYGIPFPVYCRPAFGIRGANVPALLRALVASAWRFWPGRIGKRAASGRCWISPRSSRRAGRRPAGSGGSSSRR